MGRPAGPRQGRRKKLSDAGRYWAGAGRVEDTRDSDAAALGIKSHQPAEVQAFELWAENRQAFEVFCACRTQWRVVAGMGGAHYQGLDYGALESVMRMKKVEDTGELLEQIQHIEAGAAEAMNAQ